MKWQSNWQNLVPPMAPLCAIALSAAGILYWLLRPGTAPPAEQFKSTAQLAGFLLLIAIGNGIASMATVQFWKVVFRPRSRFHLLELQAHFPDSLRKMLGAEPYSGPPPPFADDYFRYEFGYFSDLLNSPTEVVMGQLRASADHILLHPEGNDFAIFELTGTDSKFQNRYRKAIHGNEPDDHEYLATIRFMADQRLNLLHVRMRDRWRRRVRIVSAMVSGLFGLCAMFLTNLQPITQLSIVFASVVWGGFFAWLARDFVALVEYRRN